MQRCVECQEEYQVKHLKMRRGVWRLYLVELPHCPFCGPVESKAACAAAMEALEDHQVMHAEMVEKVATLLALVPQVELLERVAQACDAQADWAMHHGFIEAAKQATEDVELLRTLAASIKRAEG